MRLLRLGAVPAAFLAAMATPVRAQRADVPAPMIANRAVYIDNAGVMRWRDNRQEVTLFGANYVLPTASDYRAAGYVPRRSQEDDRRGHGAVRPHGLGRHAPHLLGRLGGLRQRRQPDRQRSPGPAGLPDRPRARARDLHAVQPDPALRLELARRAVGHDGAGLRAALRQGPDGHRLRPPSPRR